MYALNDGEQIHPLYYQSQAERVNFGAPNREYPELAQTTPEAPDWGFMRVKGPYQGVKGA